MRGLFCDTWPGRWLAHFWDARVRRPPRVRVRAAGGRGLLACWIELLVLDDHGRINGALVLSMS